MHGRRAATKGMSYVQANGRLVTIENDVLDIKRRIEERWPRLSVYFDPDIPSFVVTEHCTDDIERFVTEVPTLDERLIRRLEKADTHISGQEDPVAMLDAYNAEVDREKHSNFLEKIGEANERLLHALRKDGVAGMPKIYFSGSTRAGK
jgi:hypothetical protein